MDSYTTPSKLAEKERGNSSNLPPRHRRKRSLVHRDELRRGDILVQGKTVYLYRLRPRISIEEIASLLEQLGFTSFNINHRGDNYPSSIEFSHSTVATAAFSLLQHRAASLFIEASCITTTSTQARSGVIDLTQPDLGDDTENDQHAATSLDDSDELYADLGAYDDSDSDMDISDIETSATGSGYKAVPISCEESSICQSINLNKTTDLSVTVEPRLQQAFSSVPRACGQLFAVPKAFLDVSIPQNKILGKRVAKNDTDSHNFRVVGLPVAAHNRGRRVLLPGNAELPIMTVSMRADFQFFHGKARHRISRYSIPGHADHRHVGDAVMIGDIAVVGYRSSPCQVSLICSKEGHTPILTELKHKPHADFTSPAGKKTGGVICLAAKSAIDSSADFFTGGHDRKILLWSVSTTPDVEVNTERVTTLPIRPHALAFRDRTLLVGASRKIITLDLGHLSAKWPVAQLNNIVHHIHIHKDAPSLVILETDSLDSQIQIFDERKRKNFNRTPDCTFGVRCTGSNSSLKSPCRGDTRLCLFAKGFADETVRLWDYRNSKRPVLTKVHQTMGTVTHTVFTEPEGNIICYNSSSLIFVDSPAGEIE